MRPDQLHGTADAKVIEEEIMNEDMYEVRAYTEHGYFKYMVPEMESAMQHGQTIMQSGVFRHYDNGTVIFYPVSKVKVIGPGLDTAYPAEFCRT